PERVDGLCSNLDIEELKLKTLRYFEGGINEFFQQPERLPQGEQIRVEEFYRREGIRWALELEGGQRILVLDFTTNPGSILAGDSEANCGLKIRAEDLCALLDSVELLSILTQSCSVTTWGHSPQKAYQSLNVLWYAGFEDKVRLESYLTQFQRNDILTS
ncbi:hypothetical protein HOF92_17065, partial [bacterium]|nr:hypothetical protein [bacterium]